MTIIGKLLVFLNLVMAIGMTVSSTVTYVERPNWFEKPAESVEKGATPLTFAGMKADTDSLARLAGVNSGRWGAGLKTLVERETIRDDRLKAYATRLKLARSGDGNKGAFFELDIDPKTRLVDTTKQGKPVNGTYGKPLVGAEVLEPKITALVAEKSRLGMDIEKLQADLTQKGEEIYGDKTKGTLGLDQRIAKLFELRDALDNELFFLSGFEVNWYAQLTTVERRKRQLDDRLKLLKGKPETDK